MMQIINMLLGIVFSLFEAIFTSAVELGVSAIPSKRKHEYDADFEKPGVHLQKQTESPGFYIGTFTTGKKEANSHMICIGGSGSKKSTTTVFTTLLQNNTCSYVIHDCSKELINGCGHHLENNGYEIIAIDPSSEYSEGFNFIAKSKSVDELNKNLSVVFSNTMPNENDYWRQSAEAMALLFTKALWKYAQPEHKNVTNLLHLVTTYSYAPDKLDKWFVSTRDNQLITEYKSLCSTPQKTLLCTVSTLKSALSIYLNENVQRITSYDTIDFDRFRHEKIALFLLNSPASAYTYRSITATFIQAFFNHILEKQPTADSLDITFLLDEAAVVKLPTLSQFLALSRKYKISVATLWQDFQMIESIYGKHEASNIFSNSNLKVFLPCSKPLETCVMLEKLCGKYHYTDEHGVQRTRELMTAQEIYNTDKIIVLNSNNKPTLLEPSPYFSIPHLRRLTEVPPYICTNTLPNDPIPLIEL